MRSCPPTAVPIRRMPPGDPMRILLVDDSLTIRSMLRRTLNDVLSADPPDVAEAPNGVEALAQIARRPFDLVVLDVNMPVMDGLETLEAIRSSPDHAGLRVVMLTSEKGEALVRRLVELGITDFLSKPLSKDALGTRLARILARLQEPKPGATSEGSAVHRMMVVERDAERRSFLMRALAGRYDLIEADSAASALQACMASAVPPDFVLAGPRIGLPPVDMFVARLRAIPQLAKTRVLGCVARGEPASAAHRGLFDACVELSHVPEAFVADLERAITGAQTPLMRILLVRPSLAEDVARSTEQVFGMMLSCELEPAGSDTRRPDSLPSDVHSAIGLETEDHAVLTLEFRADVESARAIAGRMIGVPPAEVQEADVLASAAELSNIVLGRLRNRLIEAGLPASMQLPETWTGLASGPGVQDDPQAIVLSFFSHTLDAGFDFSVFARAAKDAG